MNSVILGVGCGLVAAAFSSLSFLISRHHGLRAGDRSTAASVLRLLVLSHCLMGAACLPLTWALWPSAAAATTGDVVRAARPLLCSMTCYLLGQTCMFLVLGRVNASRVSPLLGLKVLMLAGMTTLLMGHALDWRQWTGVCLSAAAAATLRSSGGAIPAGSTALIVLACLLFSVSDLSIVGLIDAIEAGWSVGRMHAGLLAMTTTYAACGMLALPVVLLRAPWRRGEWLAAAAYAGAWMASMVGLYFCFGLIGAVFGNVMQSTRGLMSVVIGAVLAHLGWHELEHRVDRRTLIARAVAAVMMTAAIALYTAGRTGAG